MKNNTDLLAYEMRETVSAYAQMFGLVIGLVVVLGVVAAALVATF